MNTFEKVEAVLAILGGASILIGAVWTVLRLVSKGQDAPEHALAAQRHAQVVARLTAVEHEMEELKKAKDKTEERLSDVERTMATRDDIKELAQKLENLKRDIVSDIAALLQVARNR